MTKVMLDLVVEFKIFTPDEQVIDCCSENWANNKKGVDELMTHINIHTYHILRLYCMRQKWEHVSMHWQQGKCQLCANCFLSWMPAANWGSLNLRDTYPPPTTVSSVVYNHYSRVPNSRTYQNRWTLGKNCRKHLLNTCFTLYLSQQII